jgi:hypothetical protein
MNKPHETHPTRENLEARVKELEGGQHAQGVAAVVQPPINITMLTGELFAVKEQLAAANKDLEILSIEKDRAREDAENWQLEAEAAYKQVDEAIRRLRQMHRSHSDSVQWYQNAVAQALKSLNALPDKLEFEMSEKTPGQVAREEFWNGGRQTDRFDQIASAVIAHVRPQIERDARAVAIEEAENVVAATYNA